MVIAVALTAIAGCREPAPGNGDQSSNADLSDLTISAGTLDPAFESGVTSYAVALTDTASVTVRPTAADEGATITVNSMAVASGSASAPIDLAPGDNTITIQVTAEDLTQKPCVIIATLPTLNLVYVVNFGSDTVTHFEATTGDYILKSRPFTAMPTCSSSKAGVVLRR